MLYNQVDQTYSPFPVTLNSFAAFAAANDIPVDRYAPPSGDIYVQLAAKYGPVVAGQVYNAALDGDRQSMSQILGSAIPLGQPGGGTVQPPLDESVTDAFVGQITSDPLKAPVDALLGKGSSGLGGTSTTGMVIIGLGAIGLLVLLTRN